MRNLLRDTIKDHRNVLKRILFSVSIAISIQIYGILNNYRGKVYHIQTAFDTAIPFNKYFVVPYIIWYFYVAFVLFYYAVYDDKRYFKLLAGINIGMLICYVIYYFFPTYTPRPTVYGNDIFADAVRFVYSRDNPYNCFPSIHVLDSVLIGVYINRDENISPIAKLISTAIAISIVFSTLFIKQHYVYDVISGAILAYSIYIAFNYREILEKIRSRADVAVKATKE
jgi:membrane-associated phospholipid phosphatase